MNAVQEASVLFEAFSEESACMASFVAKLAEFTSPMSEDGASLSKNELCQLFQISSDILATANRLHNVVKFLSDTCENSADPA